jgi:hypothetical protein
MLGYVRMPCNAYAGGGGPIRLMGSRSRRIKNPGRVNKKFTY